MKRHGSARCQDRQEAIMSMKIIGPFAILGVAGLLIAACGDEREVDAGASRRAPAVAEYAEGWPVTADGTIRRELAKLEAERAARSASVEYSEGWPLTADGAVRRELAKLQAERARRAASLDDWGNWPLTADGAIRRELATLEATRAAD
jgi:hypothetical protein